MISDARMEKALTYLAETDEPSAVLKAALAKKEYLCKLARSKVYLVSEGSVEARKAKSEVSPEVEQAENELAEAIVELEKVKAKRATEELVIETWRTYQANRRIGNLT